MYQHILIPLDNSPADEAILQHIRPLAKLTAARITLIHVADGFMARNQQRLRLDESDEMRQDRLYLEQRQAELQGEGFSVNSLLATGEPADQILATCEREHCDLIAMSTHGHGFLSDWCWVALRTKSVHRTDMPVLLIRSPFA